MLTRLGFIKLYFLLWWLKILLMPPTDQGVEFFFIALWAIRLSRTSEKTGVEIWIL